MHRNEAIEKLNSIRPQRLDWNTGQFKTVEGVLTFEAPEQEVEVNEFGAGKLASQVGIFGPYIQKCPANLAAVNLNYWMRQNYDNTHSFIIQDGQITSVVRTQAPDPNPELMISTMEEYLPPELAWDVNILKDFTVEVKAIAQEEKPLVAGDAYNFGIALGFAWDEAVPLSLEGYLHRLICTNGMYRRNQLIKMSRKTPDDMLISWLHQNTQQVWSVVDSEFQHLLELRNTPIPKANRARFLEQTLADLSVPRQAHEAVLNQVSAEPVDTVYDVMNAITHVGSHGELDPTLSRRLQEAGGDLIEHHSICSSCNRLLN